jgi:hypothetical protein
VLDGGPGNDVEREDGSAPPPPTHEEAAEAAGGASDDAINGTAGLIGSRRDDPLLDAVRDNLLPST